MIWAHGEQLFREGKEGVVKRDFRNWNWFISGDSVFWDSDPHYLQ